MAAHRYWRAVGPEAYATGDLELSEFQLLFGGARVDAPATLTASSAPDVSGVLANLQDDVLNTSARWSGQAVKSLFLTWDFGVSPVDADDIRLAGDSNARFLLIVKMQWSNDAATWTDLTTLAGIAWPGAVTKTSSSAGVIVRNTVKGGVTTSDTLSVGTGPTIVYGIAKIAPPIYLGVETGSVKDYIKGVLGQGIGRVRGTVKEKGTPNAPVFRKVRLARESDGLVLREQWSDSLTGAYDFQYIDEAQKFTVLSYDHLHNYRAIVADNITPELMP